MSEYVVENEVGKFVFGWDHPFGSFYLKMHDRNVDPEDNPVICLGSTGDTRVHTVEDLVRMAAVHGLYINTAMQVHLHTDRDNGR